MPKLRVVYLIGAFLLAVPRFASAQQVPTEHSIIQCLDQKPRSEWEQSEDPPEDSPDLDKLEEAFQNLEPKQAAGVAETLLKPRAGRFAPPQLLDELVRKVVFSEDGDFSADRIAISRNLANYVDFHWGKRSRKREKSNQALYLHLSFLSDRYQTWLLREVLIEKVLPAAKSIKPATAQIAVSRQPKETPSLADTFLAPDELMTAGGFLFTSSNKNSLRFDPKTGRIDIIAPPKGSDQGPLLLAANDSALYATDYRKCFVMDPTGNEWVAVGDYNERNPIICEATATNSGLTSYFSPPPHYYGDLEREPDLLKRDPHYLDTTLQYWDREKRQGKQLEPGSKLPFLGSVGMKFRASCISTTANGNPALGLSDRESQNTRENIPLSLFVANSQNPQDGFRKAFQYLGEATIQPGFVGDELLFVPKAMHVDPIDDGFFATSCVLYDSKNNTVKELFRRYQPYDGESWPLLKLKQPKDPIWQLPPEFDAPHPGIQTLWHRLFVKGDKLVAYVSQWRFGRENAPLYSLLVFTPGQKMARQVPVDFEMTDAINQRLAEGGYVGWTPTPTHRIQPVAFDCRSELALVSHFGIWRISWETVLSEV